MLSRFWVWASQDPAGPPLDRLQIVKGWIENGEQHQRVWDVACSSGRTPDKNGQCPKTTADVDPTTCERTGDAGAEELEVTRALEQGLLAELISWASRPLGY